ncbi:MAG: ABC transporter substrate-binding protein [Anaerolineaceae bacterium]|nr:ABC transporter substrate-binding protein [Anaerolineaceae bacterium]
MRIRLSLLVNFILMVSLLLAGCQSSPNADPVETVAEQPATAADQAAEEPSEVQAEPVTITFWNSFTGSDGDTLKEIVADFNEAYQGKILIEMDIMSSSVFTQKVPPAIATNTAPDLIALNIADTLAYSKQGSIEDLSDFFSVSGADQTDFIPSALELGKFDEKLYGIPMQLLDTTNMYWNKDLFEAAGLDPESPPTTFAELEEYAIKLTDESKGQYGLGMCASAAPQFYAVFIKGNGGDVVDVSTNKSVLDSDANMETFEYLHRLAYEEEVSPKSTGGVAMDNLMQSGQLGIYINGPWLIPGLVSHNINFGVAQIPGGSAGAVAIYDGTLFSIPTGTEDSQKVAVYEFLKYWNSTEIGKKWSLSVGIPPYLNSVINDPEIQADANIAILANNGKNAAPWMGGVDSAANIDANVLFPLIEQLQNEGDVEEMVKGASEQIDAILQEN